MNIWLAWSEAQTICVEGRISIHTVRELKLYQ
jgi:hypothetical protein